MAALDGAVVEDTAVPAGKAVMDMLPGLWSDQQWESSHFGMHMKKE